MNNYLKLITVIYFASVLTSCSSLGWLKFWEDEEKKDIPEILRDIEQKLTISSLWDVKVGRSNEFGRILVYVCCEYCVISGLC